MEMLNRVLFILILASASWLMLYAANAVYNTGQREMRNTRETEKLWRALARQERKIIELSRRRAVRSTVTGYSSEIRQTDSTPFTTAFMTRVKPGLVAVSWNLLEEGWTPGKCIWIDGVGVRKIDDSMARDTEGAGVDIWFHSRADALEFGRKFKVLVLLLEECGDNM